MLSSHVKRSLSLWLHNKSRLCCLQLAFLEIFSKGHPLPHCNKKEFVFRPVLLPCLVTTRSTLRPLKIFKWNGLTVFQRVYIINRILHARLWVWILSSRVQHDISLARCVHSWYRFEHAKIKFIPTRGDVISSILSTRIGGVSCSGMSLCHVKKLSSYVKYAN